ncbi:UDP-N-acetylmuramate dehydrogenase [Psittacicella gerlachiana]|uniref:UDP-N-acetylenolpyruvoylglucosamine reductase n=1 Tax=Psittacicella gerlachiana TaxID=2028574 RepID=A0A3A1YE13_9GAMM|nr:UDP-N-acetylmuramate dehydrogenase [Psittacicella gerlachiana]RIY35378.1 UDP-N-acetylenolpyruvoylglucosamine reductase [Psittacicella gerlachiana]
MNENIKIDNHQLTTFRIPIKADKISFARWPHEFLQAYQRTKENNQELIILGQGSNVLFLEDFNGEIVVNQYQGIHLTCTQEHFVLQVNSGVTIDELIAYCHRFKIYGLENLASIPSSIGTAAIGNIGAYGVEFEKFVDKVILLDLERGEKITLTHEQLQFSYRSSILKTEYNKGYAVLTVVLKIAKNYQPVLTYYPLTELDKEQVTAKQIQELVVKTRKAKLPDFNQYGNGGSFFVNPIISSIEYQVLKERFNLQGIILNQEQVKLSAGWLIENTGLKGFSFRGAQVSPQHALVLTNREKATGMDIANLAAIVKTKVFEKFGVQLTPEIRFIAKNGEVDASLYLEHLHHN